MGPHGKKKSKKESRSQKHLGHGSRSVQAPQSVKTQKLEKSGNQSLQRKQSSKTSKAATVEDAASEDEEDELQATVSKPTRVRKVRPKKILDAIKTAASYLSSIGTLEDVELWLEEHGFNEKECLEDIRRHCRLISDLLTVQKSEANDDRQLSGTLASLGQFYIYRNASKAVGLLAPVELFSAGKNYATRKGFGFVRKTGSYFPSIFAISGYSESLQAAEKLLDSIFWTNELMEFGKHYDFNFKSDGWDGVHGKEKGTDHASHAENQLMLAWAYRLLAKATGSAPSFRKLHHLRRMEIPKDAEIALNDKPCVGCRLFQKELELITGIKFSFIELPTVGNMRWVKNDKGYKTWRTEIHVQLEEKEETEEGLAEVEEEVEEHLDSSRPAPRQVEENRKKRFEIVLPSRSISHTQETRVVEDSEAESEEIMVSTRVKVSKTQRRLDFAQYYHTPNSGESTKKRLRTYANQSDEEEWEPPSRSRSRLRNEDMMTPVKNIITRNGLITPPDSAEFGQNALQFVRKINQKRKSHVEIESSPSSSKRLRLRKH